ncbi:MAG: hypothetical protein RLZZ453_458 [Chlamydiota bacterium]
MNTVYTPIPLFNTPHFLNPPEFDAQGLWRSLETILLPGNTYTVVERGDSATITTASYPSSNPLYTDPRFIDRSELFKGDVDALTPSLEHFLQRIEECVKNKVPYLWGGNLPQGDERMGRLLYNNYTSLSKEQQRACSLTGVDCSGLIYWASNGVTPRNSSGLILAGIPVTTLDCLKPGMLIGWKGHVLIVTKKGIVESAAGKGTICTPTEEKINALVKERTFLKEWPPTPPETPSFVIRDIRALLD